MSVFIRFFHGRTDPNEKMEDWGESGAYLGPLRAVHMTYMKHVRIEDVDGNMWDIIPSNGDLIYYDEVYYGDFTVCSDIPDGDDWEEFDPDLLNHPDAVAESDDDEDDDEGGPVAPE